MIVFTLIRVGSRYGYQMFMERFGQNTIFRLVSDQYEKLHQLDFTYFNHTPRRRHHEPHDFRHGRDAPLPVLDHLQHPRLRGDVRRRDSA